MNSRLRRRPYGRPTGAAPLWRTLVMVGLCQIAGAYAAEFSSALAALERGDYVSAVSQLDELSAQGDPLATTKLASLYQEGRGVPKDATRAAMLYEQAASRGDAEAQYNLGNMYLLGEGVPQDDDWAFTYYREAAKQGHAMAQKNVAEFYRAAGLTPPPEEVNAQPPAVIARTAKSNARPLPSAPAPPVGGTVPSPAAVSAAPADYSQDELNAMQMARTHGIRIAEAGSLPPQPPPLIVPRGSLIPTPPPAGEPAGMAAPSGDISTAKALLAAGKPADARPML